MRPHELCRSCCQPWWRGHSWRHFERYDTGDQGVLELNSALLDLGAGGGSFDEVT